MYEFLISQAYYSLLTSGKQRIFCPLLNTWEPLSLSSLLSSSHSLHTSMVVTDTYCVHVHSSDKHQFLIDRNLITRRCFIIVLLLEYLYRQNCQHKSVAYLKKTGKMAIRSGIKKVFVFVHVWSSVWYKCAVVNIRNKEVFLEQPLFLFRVNEYSSVPFGCSIICT